MRVRFCVLLNLLALAGSPAAAEDIRFPATFKPALMIHTPKGWTSQKLDTLLSENLQIASDDQTIIFTISLAPTLGSVDKIAAKLLGGKPLSRAPARLAGLDAFVFRGTATNPDGLKLNLKLIVAPIDPQEAYTCMLITAMNDGDTRLAPAEALVSGIKLLPK
jgi:hypothetical protein